MAQPLVEFYQLISAPGLPHMAPPRHPERASLDASGTLPADALRYCEPVRSACSFGYHLYPPMTIALRLDGTDVMWSMDEDGSGAGGTWHPLNQSVFYPNFADHWNETAPGYLRDLVPPLIAPGGSRGMVQIWSGAIARTREDWSLLLRGPVNDSRRSLGFESLEGTIETDRWGGHLFVNILLLQADQTRPVFFHAEQPFAQAQPIHRDHYDSRLLNDFRVRTDVPEDVWQRYGEITIGNYTLERPLGQYAVDARKRRTMAR